ncbi:MAG: EAL domain-containing protein [Geminicoccaceae bacterium]
MALYQAKAKGRGRFCFFEPALLEAIERRQAIGEALQAGIAEKAFEIELQPQIHLPAAATPVSRRWSAGDATASSWRPDEFIGIAEEVGVIASLGRLVLRHALEALRRCDDLGLDAGHVAVNLAAAQLRAPGFPAEVAALLGELGLEAGRLELEVTEGVLLDRDAVAISTSLRELHGLGVTITLDDFGTGAASLAHLKSFPVDRLKIDRSFVRGIGRNADDAVFVCTIINLAHTLGMVVVAEGVETAEQEAFRAARLRSGAGLPFRPADAGGRHRRLPGTDGVLAR